MLEQTEHIDIGAEKHRIAECQERDVLACIQEHQDFLLVRLPCVRAVRKILDHWKHLIDDLDVFLEIGARDLEGDAALFFLRLGCDEDVHLLDRLNRLDR